jgi:hypothetical protein
MSVPERLDMQVAAQDAGSKATVVGQGVKHRFNCRLK